MYMIYDILSVRHCLFPVLEMWAAPAMERE